MPDGHAIVFIAPSDRGSPAIFVQDFVAGKDTSGTRRRLDGLDLESNVESFAISPDGSLLAAASTEAVFNLMQAEHLPGISAQQRQGH
jgi:hypothetical protein